MKAFRLLRADEIECRIAMVKDTGLSLLLYKTARTDADILDEAVGPERWTNDFKLIDGVLYGGIGVDYSGNRVMVWRWDAGVESNTEAEKGRASDAFKRAGFKHGIGRELYSAPFVWVPSTKCKIANKKCFERFSVSKIGYDEQERINELVIVNEKGSVVYSLNQKAPDNDPLDAFVDKVEEKMGTICSVCGTVINGVKKGNAVRTAEEIIAYSVEHFKEPMCSKCIKKAQEVLNSDT